MNDIQVSIGQVKRDISELVNRVAYGGERIVLTSRGKPKAVIVSVDDYERIRQAEDNRAMEAWTRWLAANAKLTARILAERGGRPLDGDTILEEARADLEERHDFLFDD
jgi:prevent-host-death family protein